MKNFNWQLLAPKHQITLNNFFQWLSQPHYTWKGTIISWMPYALGASSSVFGLTWLTSGHQPHLKRSASFGVLGLLSAAVYYFSELELQRILVVIDESEALFKGSAYQREHNPAVTAFLTHTGEDSKYFSIIATTNYVKDIDEAAESRLNPAIKLDNPGPEQRRIILAKYFGRYFHPKPLEEYFDEEMLNEILQPKETCKQEGPNRLQKNSTNDGFQGESETAATPNISIVQLSEGLSGRDLQKIAEQTCAEAISLSVKNKSEQVKVTKADVVRSIVLLIKGRRERLESMKEGQKERLERARERFHYDRAAAHKTKLNN